MAKLRIFLIDFQKRAYFSGIDVCIQKKNTFAVQIHSTMKAKFLLFFLAFTSICFAQETNLPTISADRPGASTGPDVMPLYKLQWETGIGYESNTNGPKTWTLNNTLLRFGLFKNAELRVGTDFLLYNDGPSKEPIFGIIPLTIGTKIKFFDGKGVLPAISLLAELKSSHIGTKDQLPSHLAPSLNLLFQNEVCNWFNVGYNVGLEWDGETATPTTFLALCLGFNISEKVGAFVESYNYLHPEEENKYLTEFGFSWLVSRRVQLDIAADLDFKHLKDFYAVSCGVAWLIN